MKKDIIIYTINTSEGEKVAEKLSSFNLKSETKHIIRDRFTFLEFKELLCLTDDGLDDLLTQRGNTMDYLINEGIHIDDLTLTEAFDLILQNPKLLKTTILTDGTKIAYGLNGTKMFIPRSVRKKKQLRVQIRATRIEKKSP